MPSPLCITGIRRRCSYLKVTMGQQRVTSSPPQTFCYTNQGGSEAPSKTLSSRDAAAKPPWTALRRVSFSLGFVLRKARGVSVCPLKPYTAWTRCRSPHGWVYGAFQRAQQSRTKSQA